MSFVLVSQNKNIVSENEELLPSIDRQEQEIELRVQQELEKLRHKILGEAEADESARAALKPLEQQLKNALSTTSEINRQLAGPLAQKEQHLADLILEIAFQLARHIVGVHVIQDQAPLLHLVKKILSEARDEQVSQNKIIIHLSPLDHPFIESNLSESNIILISDSNIEQGGALLELPPETDDFLDRTVWDAQLKSRFEVLLQALLPSTQATKE